MKRFKALLIVVIFVLPMFSTLLPMAAPQARAQASDSLFTKTFGGVGNDYADCVIQTSDGGFALAGSTNSSGAGSYDVYLVKVSVYGDLQWSKTYGGKGDDEGCSVVQTSDGGYAIAGLTTSFGASECDAYLVKTDSNGNMQWNKTYGGPGYDCAYSVVQTSDRGFALAGVLNEGYGNGDAYLVKTDSNGNLQWSKTYGGSNHDDLFRSIVKTSDGGYAMAGFTYSFGAGYADAYLVKTDSNGNMQWNKTYGGASTDYTYSVVQTSDGGYALAGGTYSFGAGSFDFYLVKTDTSGNLQWNKTYGGADADDGWSVVQTNDGGYSVAGYTNSTGADGNDVYLVKTDSSGNPQWSKTYGGTNDDFGYSVIQTPDNGYAIAGSTNSYGAGGEDVYLIKTDSTGYAPPIYNNKANLVVTVNNFDGAAAATMPGTTTVKVMDYSGAVVGQQNVDSTSKASFALNAGTYSVEVDHNSGLGLGVSELWGTSTDIVVSAGTVVNYVFTRHAPIVSNIKYSNQNPSVGQTVLVTVSVKNLESLPMGCSVRLVIDKDEQGPSYDYDQQYTPVTTVSAGETYAFVFSFTPSSAGTYYADAVAFSVYGSTFPTDQSIWGNSMIVSAQAQTGEVRFVGTAIVLWAMIGGGGWNVTVNQVISGPQIQGMIVKVGDAPLPGDHGTIDPNIKPGDTVEVYGNYTGGISVVLYGSKNYFIKDESSYDVSLSTSSLPIGVQVTFTLNGQTHGPASTPWTYSEPIVSGSSVSFDVSPRSYSSSGITYTFDHWQNSAGQTITSPQPVTKTDTFTAIYVSQNNYAISFTTTAVPAGTQVTYTVNGLDHGPLPFSYIYSQQFVSGESVSFSVSPVSFTTGGTTYALTYWENSAGKIITSPQTVAKTDTFTAVYLTTSVTATISQNLPHIILGQIDTISLSVSGLTSAGSYSYQWLVNGQQQAGTADNMPLAFQQQSFGLYTVQAQVTIVPKSQYPTSKLYLLSNQITVTLVPGLEVPYQGQAYTQWCGPTSLAMVLRYYGVEFHGWNYASDQNLGPDDGANLEPLAQYVEKNSGSSNFPSLSVERDSYHSPSEMFAGITSSLSQGYPVILYVHTFKFPQELAHVIVIMGYNSTGLFVNDPSGALFITLIGASPLSSYDQAYVSWNTLVSYVVFWPGLSTITIKGVPNPDTKYGTMYPNPGTERYVDVAFCQPNDPEGPSSVTGTKLELDHGLMWYSSSSTGSTPDNIVDPSCSSLACALNVSNCKQIPETFAINWKIIGLNGATYLSGRVNTGTIQGLSQERIGWPFLSVSSLPENVPFVIDFSLVDSTGATVDHFVTPQFSIGGQTMKSSETQHHLYLHVYDAAGNHVGLNYTTNQTELGIPGSYYYDDGNGTITISLPTTEKVKVVVDAMYAENPTETYNVTITTKSSSGVSVQNYENTIAAGQIQTVVDLPQASPTPTPTPSSTPVLASTPAPLTPMPAVSTPTPRPTPTPTIPIVSPSQTPTQAPATPEFPMFAVLPIFMSAGLFIAVLIRRKASSDSVR